MYKMIVDMHAHLTESGVPTPDLGIDKVIEHMDLVGCDYVIQSCGRTLGGDRHITESYIEDSIALYEKYDKRILSYFVYYPGKAEKSLELIDKYYGHPAFVGIKIHPSDHWVPADDESYRPIWEAAKKYDLTMMT
ncbi:MAG: amidohydrolase family protein, partial [Clostridia bacterium]|nr:amidohydrolase family protein [Clostridia bacterium]